MDAGNQKDDVLNIPFWPFLGGEKGVYFFHFFKYEHPAIHFILDYSQTIKIMCGVLIDYQMIYRIHRFIQTDFPLKITP